MEFAVSGLAYTVSHNFFNHIICDIYGVLRDNTTESHPKVQKILKELDLAADLATVESLIQEIEEYYQIPLLEEFDESVLDQNSDEIIVKQTLKNADDKQKPYASLTVCLRNVYHMVFLIKEELLAIQRLINEHKLRYFASWRSPGYGANLKRLRKYKELLDKRCDLLIKILSVYE